MFDRNTKIINYFNLFFILFSISRLIVHSTALENLDIYFSSNQRISLVNLDCKSDCTFRNNTFGKWLHTVFIKLELNTNEVKNILKKLGENVQFVFKTQRGTDLVTCRIV